MGIAEALLGRDNPFTQWVSGNQNFLGAIGSGLGQGQNLQSGLAAGLAQIPQAKQLDRADAEKLKAEKLAETQANATQSWLEANHPDLAQMVTAGMPVSEAWQTAMQRMQPQGGADPTANMQDWQFGQQNPGYWDALHPGQGGGAGNELKTGYTPVWGTIDGKQTVALPGNDGKLYIDGKPLDATNFVPTNPYDLNAQKAGGLAFGKATGGAQFSVPDAKLELDQSNAAIAKLSEPEIKKGMDDWFNQWGALPRGMWVQGGSNMAQFRNSAGNVIDRSWLSARAALKGGGQITDYEGAKAENAVSMMKAALDSGDKASFETARDDYEYWIKQGFAKLQQQAGALPGYGSPSGGGADAPTGGYTVLGVE